ncbi:MAG: hypothetical protein IM631_00795 [Cytophagales bacterium]|jgi:glutamate racemase|nr:hypothetical protein [Cytophagales bacterium]MCA6369905.1 hypothetical protein [Cytophagales bacterium]MCA6375063.1 hypothetical protein [Cytophagales bacterium]MCA6382626.1 hypothetical protein [Cytophagales bacterium]
MMKQTDWNEKVKRLLKSELVKRGITTENLVDLLNHIGVKETKASIDSKISRGTFGATFLIQCLQAIGCKNFVPEVEASMIIAAEPESVYKKAKKNKVKEYARS